MCTAITLKTENFYFGRTLDYDFSYGEQVVITPRGFKFFWNGEESKKGYAIIGMALVSKEFPLYYDGFNEKGLCMAGLNFVGNAKYNKPKPNAQNVPQYAFIPYVLHKCATVQEAVSLIKNINLTDEKFADDMPAAQLHWLVADKTQAVVVEFTEEGLRIYDNDVGVLTNNPPFKEQLSNLSDYMSLTSREPQNTFANGLNLRTYSRGMGALGLPGDLSSKSRFVRAAFMRGNSVCGKSEEDSVNQFFHVLGAVENTRGACAVGNNYEITVYTCCCSPQTGFYYYTTYQNHCITAVSLFERSLEGEQVFCYPLATRENIVYQK